MSRFVLALALVVPPANPSARHNDLLLLACRSAVQLAALVASPVAATGPRSQAHKPPSRLISTVNFQPQEPVVSSRLSFFLSCRS